MPRFAVAAGHALTAEAAERALRDGGTAVDACIAGALAACVAEPVLAGFFGGGFLMVRDPSGRARLLDFFVQTPRRRRPEAERDLREVHADFGEAAQAFHIGAAAIAAPGLPSGLWEAQARYGRLPMTELARPAAEAAAAGAPLSAFQARVLDVVGPIYRASPEALKLFGPDGDRLASAGETLANPAFADVLEEWAREGPRFASQGEAGAALLSLAEAGGHLTAQDLTAYAPVWRDPTVERRGDLRLLLNPAPSLGGALIGFSLALLPSAATALDQACAFAATARARLEAGDAALDVLATPERRARWAEIAARPAALRGTTHISAVDASGLAAAMTLSNGEGCGLIAPGLGIMPNNMMGEADLLPQGLDRWAPDRRLASMMAPTLADRRDGSVAALGSGGSNRIRSAMASVLARLADGAPLDLAVAAPRVHAEGRAPQVDFEDDLPEGEREALLAAFPEARPWAPGNLYFGGVHAVRRDPSGAVDAAADARRDGAVRLG